MVLYHGNRIPMSINSDSCFEYDINVGEGCVDFVLVRLMAISLLHGGRSPIL